MELYAKVIIFGIWHAASRYSTQMSNNTIRRFDQAVAFLDIGIGLLGIGCEWLFNAIVAMEINAQVKAIITPRRAQRFLTTPEEEQAATQGECVVTITRMSADQYHMLGYEVGPSNE